MRAIVAESGTDLDWREVPDVTAADGEVVIDVVTAGVNRADLLQAAGHYPPPPGASTTIGLEVSGRISEVGAGVTAWSVGQPVCALLAGGGYAERVAVPAGQVMPIPDGVGLHEAAALPEVACTVWSNLGMTAHLTAGQTVLFHGGASGIGTHGIQVAHALGCRVAVTAGSAEKLEVCRDARRRHHRSTTATRTSSSGSRPRPTAWAPTSSSTSWARPTWTATSTRWRPTAGSSSSASRAASRPS